MNSNIKDCFVGIRWKDQVILSIMMEVHTLGSLDRVKNMVMGYGYRVMVVDMKDIGLRVSEMVWVPS
jgi:hypothetical protein